MGNSRYEPVAALPLWDCSGLSNEEEAVWLAEDIVPGTAVNNLPVAFTVAGHLNPDIVRAALALMLKRHQALRTVYKADGTNLSARVSAVGEFQIGVDQVRMKGEPSADGLTPFAAESFRLDGQPLLRAALFQYTDSDVFCVVLHRLIFDEPSRAVFIEEFAAAYEAALAGQEDSLFTEIASDAVPGVVESRPSQESLDFWQRELAGFGHGDLDLACALVGPVHPTLAAASVSHPLMPDATAVARGLRERLGVAEDAILLAAYCVLLDAHGVGPDLMTGTSVNVRPDHQARVIGYHVNDVPVRVTVDRGHSIADLIRDCHRTLQAARAHADVPVDAYYPALLGGSTSALFRYAFGYEAVDGPAGFRIAGLAARPLAVLSGCAKPDLELSIRSVGGELVARVIYRTEVLSRLQAELMLERYDAVVRSLAEARLVGDVQFWSEKDHAVIDSANDTAGPVEPSSVLHGIHRSVAMAPGAVAVVEGDREVTYRQLWEAAHAVRRLVTSAGLGAGDVVAVALQRGADLAAAVLGIWLAGAAYLPVDPAHPEERIRYQLSDSRARVLLASDAMADLAGDGLTVLPPPSGTIMPSLPDAPPVHPDPGSCAYLMYTSGSTGRPKGTLVSHSALANLVAHFAEELKATAADATLWMTTFAFDISGLELFVPLTTGGRVIAAPETARADGRVLRELAERHDTRFIQATPTTWRLVINHAQACLGSRTVLCGGETVPVGLARRLVAAGCELHHVYGPTETTIWSTSCVVAEQPESRLDVGRPIRNTQLLVLDERGRALPVGVRGELCIAGAGVAIGYHNRPQLSAQRFGTHPAYGRYYRTGDMASWREDGVIDLLGRSDRQVKLRGNRIELGEIEGTLLTHKQVRAAAVIMVGDPTADAVLVAFLEAGDDGLDTATVRDHARARLPRSMVPGDFIVLPALPVNGSGKVDYPALAHRMAQQLPDDRTARGADADGHLLETVIALWQSLLERQDVTADTNFFENGGHSMLAAVALHELERTFGISLSLSELFEDPTPRALVARVRDCLGAQRSEEG